jgi:hypothetical protein
MLAAAGQSTRWSWIIPALVAAVRCSGGTDSPDVHYPPGDTSGWNAEQLELYCERDSECDDGLACTTDSCNGPANQCVYALQGGFCVVYETCYAAGSTPDWDRCLSCDPARATGSFIPRTCPKGWLCAPESGACTNIDEEAWVGDVEAGEAQVEVVEPACAANADCAPFVGPCTRALCVGGKCRGEPDWDGTACDDGDPATVADYCLYGLCHPGVAALECVTAAQCEGDGNLCHGPAVCRDGRCAAGPEPECVGFADSDCRATRCDPLAGSCRTVQRDDWAYCNDLEPCSGDDHCLEGECTGEPITWLDDDDGCCPPGANPVDDNDCPKR